MPPGPWSAPPRAAIVLPIRSIIAHQLAGFLVLGLSSRLQFNDNFLKLSPRDSVFALLSKSKCLTVKAALISY